MMSAWMLTAAALPLTSISGDSAVTCTDSVTPAIGQREIDLQGLPEVQLDVRDLLVVKPRQVADTS